MSTEQNNDNYYIIVVSISIILVTSIPVAMIMFKMNWIGGLTEENPQCSFDVYRKAGNLSIPEFMIEERIYDSTNGLIAQNPMLNVTKDMLFDRNLTEGIIQKFYISIKVNETLYYEEVVPHGGTNRVNLWYHCPVEYVVTNYSQSDPNFYALNLTLNNSAENDWIFQGVGWWQFQFNTTIRHPMEQFASWNDNLICSWSNDSITFIYPINLTLQNPVFLNHQLNLIENSTWELRSTTFEFLQIVKITRSSVEYSYNY